MPGAAPVVRMACALDANRLADLRWAWRVQERGETGMSRQEFRVAFARWFCDHELSHVAFVATVAEAAVGMAWLATIERVPGPGRWRRLAGNVQSVYVLPTHRKRGLGAALITAALQEAVQRGCDYVSVHPSESAFPLYRRLGFRQTGDLLDADLRSLRT